MAPMIPNQSSASSRTTRDRRESATDNGTAPTVVPGMGPVDPFGDQLATLGQHATDPGGSTGPGGDDEDGRCTRGELLAASRLLVEQLGARPTALHSAGISDADRDRLIVHLGRATLQAARKRDFRTAWRTTDDGSTVARLYTVGSKALARCQYVALTHRQRASVAVVDVDIPGTPGGSVENLNREVFQVVLLQTP